MRQEVALKRTTNRLTEENAPFYDSSTGIGDLTYTCQALETRSWLEEASPQSPQHSIPSHGNEIHYEGPIKDAHGIIGVGFN